MNTIKETADGSLTLYNEQFDQHYHSIFGAEQESQRVFIELGLIYALECFEHVNIFEMGFGTGLNTAMTWEVSNSLEVAKQLSYTGLEAYPVGLEAYQKLKETQVALHKLAWNQYHQLTKNFAFQKLKGRWQDFSAEQDFNLVYYDAFAPESQPELWTQEVFEKLASFMEKDGILTTYCSKGYVQRNLKAAGFEVSKHRGPARKREVLRAVLK